MQTTVTLGVGHLCTCHYIHVIVQKYCLLGITASRARSSGWVGYLPSMYDRFSGIFRVTLLLLLLPVAGGGSCACVYKLWCCTCACRAPPPTPPPPAQCSGGQGHRQTHSMCCVVVYYRLWGIYLPKTTDMCTQKLLGWLSASRALRARYLPTPLCAG